MGVVVCGGTGSKSLMCAGLGAQCSSGAALLQRTTPGVVQLPLLPLLTDASLFSRRSPSSSCARQAVQRDHAPAPLLPNPARSGHRLACREQRGGDDVFLWGPGIPVDGL